jgi:hypothetical protein
MKIKSFNSQRDKKVIKKYNEIFGKKLDDSSDDLSIGVFYDNDKLVGYVVYLYQNSETVEISWIWGPNYGKKMMKSFERKMRREEIKKIILQVSIDPTENKTTVMKRMNYYITLKYKIYDIKFRQKNGPLLFMEKILNYIK